MSGASETAARRAVRKAFGPEALTILNQQRESLQFISAAIVGTERRCVAIEKRCDQIESLAALDRDHTTAQIRHAALEIAAGCEPQRSRGFLGRWRWLLTGR